MVLSKVSLQKESVVKAIYLVAELIAKKSKPFADGKFIKECIVCVADVICPEKKDICKNKSARQTITRRVENLGNSIQETLIAKAQKFSSYSLALDGSTDVKSTAQLHSSCEELMTILKLPKNLQTLSQLKARLQALICWKL